jgi:membrane protein required for colicin V production
MNSFDAAVYLVLLFALVTGFNTGLLRSAITILAYLIAMPIAMMATSLLAPQIGGKFGSDFGPSLGPALAQNSMLFFAIFLISGMLLGKMARLALDDATGSQAHLVDRVGGAALGAVRVGLVATTLVLVFDQFVPTGFQPAFLTGSQLRPLFSTAGQMGLRSLPPDLAATIVRLKQAQRT